MSALDASIRLVVARMLRTSREHPITRCSVAHLDHLPTCTFHDSEHESTRKAATRLTTKMPANAKEAKKFSPTLTRLLKARPAPLRETSLLDAASSDAKPVKPPPGECCGSSCDPCVMDLYAQELKVWKECAAYRESLRPDVGAEGSGSEESDRAVARECRVPGAFEW